MTDNPILYRTANVLYWAFCIAAVLGSVLAYMFFLDKGNALHFAIFWMVIGALPYGIGYALRYILTGYLDHPFFSKLKQWLSKRRASPQDYRE